MACWVYASKMNWSSENEWLIDWIRSWVKPLIFLWTLTQYWALNFKYKKLKIFCVENKKKLLVIVLSPEQEKYQGFTTYKSDYLHKYKVWLIRWAFFQWTISTLFRCVTIPTAHKHLRIYNFMKLLLWRGCNLFAIIVISSIAISSKNNLHLIIFTIR